MLLLDGNLEVDSLKHLLEAGASVNAPLDPCEQSPVHLAAGGGRACFLLWQLQTGADLNQQDVFGEALIHKAAKAGSLECLSLLVASDAKIEQKNQVNRPPGVMGFQHSHRSGAVEVQETQVGKGSVDVLLVKRCEEAFASCKPAAQLQAPAFGSPGMSILLLRRRKLPSKRR